LGTKATELLYEIHLEGATDTAILQGNKIVVSLRNHSTSLDKFGIDIHLTDIIDYNSKSYPLAIREDTIEKCSLATSEIARKQQDWNIIELMHTDCIKQSIY
jgi:hypothetical protein